MVVRISISLSPGNDWNKIGGNDYDLFMNCKTLYKQHNLEIVCLCMRVSVFNRQRSGINTKLVMKKYVTSVLGAAARRCAVSYKDGNYM